ncbi:DEAD/DEAH box helicase [uncultured Duncaniella sp.]|uniref:DEAD/DEAH box helicase n=3 Tax=uncultured Duncaniella sp. TaxID=2768039 RepID=UPI0025A59633|nr:DEAD/DEAH box helicase [uncultured Duncaniella sp.]
MEVLKHNLKVTPYEYQQEGILFGLRKKRFLIGDEPGLGKTLQSIGVVDCARAYPCLVICPASLKINWQREFEKFADVRALVLQDSVRGTFPYLLQRGMYQVAIVNFESLRKYFVWDIKSKGDFRLKDVVFGDYIKLFRSVIIDESHKVKDPSAQQTIFTKGICTGKKYIALLSGTPVVNRPEDLIAQLSIMDRLGENFGSRSQFVSDYCSFGKDQKEEQAEALAELSRKLYAHCMIRREKKTVLKELPDKTRTDLIVDLDPKSREIYNTASENLQKYLEEYTQCTDVEIRRKMRMEALVKFMTLRSLSAKGKIKQAVDFINTFLANDRPLILFCSLHEIVDALKKAFPKAVSVTGRDSIVEKQAAVDSFQNGHAQLIICSIKAAGVGLTLTASSNVAFIEFPWTYADCCQCEDRAHRIGQEDNVTCYYLLGRATIDRVLYNIIQQKKSIANQIMATNDDIPQDEMYFNELVTMFMGGSEDGGG